MNERITLLALKASNPETGWLDREKFAELIVRECVAKTMEVGEQNREPIEPIWVAHCIAHRIFKHFGVGS